MQEGEVTVRGGTETEVRYLKPYQSPPHLALVELRGAQAAETLYSKDDLHIVRQDATSFRVRNDHDEHGENWVTVKWRAEGVLDQGQPGGLAGDGTTVARGDRSPQEVLIERIKNAGGKVGIDPNAPRDDDPAALLADRDGNKNAKPALDVTLTSTVDPRLAKNSIWSIDLHRTRVTDADMAQLEPLSRLRSLNLFGTKITDAGLRSLSGLKELQTLYLNDTAVTDAGLQNLQGLKKLSDLGLNKTRITDGGLTILQGLTNLHSLSLSETQITDRGLETLKSLRTLKHLYVARTRVTATGLESLKKALPGLQISK
jgi:hypothetical protein